MSVFQAQLRSAFARRPALERRALGGVEDALAVVVEEDHDLVVAQAGVGEDRRILGQRHGEVLVRAHLLQGGLARRDRRLVAEAGGLGEDEDVEARRVLSGGARWRPER
jgi:hypothetical protein